jgi:hypothetical protein
VQRHRDDHALEREGDAAVMNRSGRCSDQAAQATASDSVIDCAANAISTAAMRCW